MSSVANTKADKISPPTKNPVKNRSRVYILYVGEKELAKANTISPVNEMYQIFLRPYLSASVPSTRAPKRLPVISTDCTKSALNACWHTRFH